MIILIAGDTHTGKTLLAQRLLEKYKYPYLSIDHLKMGLIRSRQCKLKADADDKDLTEYLWPIVREIIKTCIENSQHLIIEGCYIPFHWKNDFTNDYLTHIKYICLIFSRKYILNNYPDILAFENTIEQRPPIPPDLENMYHTNEYNLQQCLLHKYKYILIDDTYQVTADDVTEQI